MSPKPSGKADHKDRTAALALIEESAVMTLAVTTAEGPWAAPVYYVYRPADTGFYFLSSPESRHVAAALATGGCSATIFRPADATVEENAWETICGLQMRGKLTAPGTLTGARALARYLKKFPFSRSLLPVDKESLKAFRGQLGVSLYRFRAEYVEWTDNRVRFGFRCRLVL